MLMKKKTLTNLPSQDKGKSNLNSLKVFVPEKTNSASASRHLNLNRELREYFSGNIYKGGVNEG